MDFWHEQLSEWLAYEPFTVGPEQVDGILAELERTNCLRHFARFVLRKLASETEVVRRALDSMDAPGVPVEEALEILRAKFAQRAAKESVE